MCNTNISMYEVMQYLCCCISFSLSALNIVYYAPTYVNRTYSDRPNKREWYESEWKYINIITAWILLWIIFVITEIHNELSSTAQLALEYLQVVMKSKYYSYISVG